MSATEPMVAEFAAEPLTRRVVRISDRLGVLMHLVIGRERAVLIDSGFGVGDLRTFLGSLTDRPLTVLLTHGHVDHAFGAGWFTDVRMHPADREVLETHRIPSAEVVATAVAEGRPIADPPRPESFGALSAEESFDLGGLTVHALAAPGHTPGSVAFLIDEERMLLTGDAANQRTFLFLPEASSVVAYQESMARLRAETAGRYDRVLVSHGSGEVPVTLLEDLDALCTRVRERSDAAVPFEFQSWRGRSARRLDGDGSTANLVYDPARIGAPAPRPTRPPAPA
jgi:glyoxylase-like metal-dependent hydrolase (beta-lactamase superfamily II)